MKVYIGADHNGFEMKAHLVEYVRHLGYEVSDEGDDVLNPVDDYPKFASQVVQAMRQSDDQQPRGILLCGSGQGICIAANRFKGIRAAVCDTVEEARVGRNDDDTNVLCLPAATVGEARAKEVVKAWLEASFAGAARYKRRIVELDSLG
jgi:ribose 5-phosphate isomerase B